MSEFIFGRRSTERLDTCHCDIQHVMRLALYISKVDFFVAEGTRPEDKQNEYFMSGASKVEFPNSYHNEEPLSLGVDAVPYVNGKAVWRYNSINQMEAWNEVVRAIKLAAKILNVPLDWGFDLWKWDRPHWQLTSYRNKS